MQRPTILIVDDEQTNIKLVKAMLIPENYLLIEAASGEKALECVEDNRPDLILLDVMMPGIDGYKVCRRLKQNKKTRIIPVVMVTALKEKKHRIKAIKAGADDFLTKPVDQTELQIRVKSLLRLKSYHDALRRSEEKHRLILGANPDPIILYDMEGKVTYLNSAFTSVFGWTMEELFDRTMEDFVPDEVRFESNALTDKMLAGERLSGFETHRSSKDGNLIPVSISG
ncbi:MAG: response regulator, partial [Desulfobacterales bacterium]|nr:response regulator [Desulfobacterales bacterium]MDX2496242.1 response regulator [Desulfuromusa sp.]